MIIWSPGGRAALDSAEVVNAVKSNPNGWGVAWQAKGKVRVVKGFGQGRLDKALAHIPAAAPVAIHARWATMGEVSRRMCHPFGVGGGCVLFHNGCASVPLEAEKDKARARWSDTKWIAAELRRVAYGDPAAAAEYLGKWERSSRWLVMGPAQVAIAGESSGEWAGGCWYSNPFGMVDGDFWRPSYGRKWESKLPPLRSSDAAYLGEVGLDSGAEEVSDEDLWEGYQLVEDRAALDAWWLRQQAEEGDRLD